MTLALPLFELLELTFEPTLEPGLDEAILDRIPDPIPEPALLPTPLPIPLPMAEIELNTCDSGFERTVKGNKNYFDVGLKFSFYLLR